MNTRFAILLIVLLSLRGIHTLYVFSYFYLNKEYIIENLCINREKPVSRCAGHCFVQKELNKTNKDNKVPASVKPLERIEFVQEKILTFTPLHLFRMVYPFRPIMFPVLEQLICEVFHPPACQPFV
jgi:hypothetical protein